MLGELETQLAAAAVAADEAGRCWPVRLAATLEGPAGAPVLVLGNSLGTTGEVWEPQAAVLGERFRLLRFEHRGHGGSPAPPGPYTIGELGADVLRLLDGFGVQTASYCGISLGGMIGMWLAAHAPERIDALAALLHVRLPAAGRLLDRPGGAGAGGGHGVAGRAGGGALVHFRLPCA